MVGARASGLRAAGHEHGPPRRRGPAARRPQVRGAPAGTRPWVPGRGRRLRQRAVVVSGPLWGRWDGPTPFPRGWSRRVWGALPESGGRFRGAALARCARRRVCGAQGPASPTAASGARSPPLRPVPLPRGRAATRRPGAQLRPRAHACEALPAPARLHEGASLAEPCPCGWRDGRGAWSLGAFQRLRKSLQREYQRKTVRTLQLIKKKEDV